MSKMSYLQSEKMSETVMLAFADQENETSPFHYK